MISVNYCFLEPLDVLLLRGNKLFGDPGSFGESLMPPWPSVAAGALRSRLLADDAVDIGDFVTGKVTHPSLGTPSNPGAFTVTEFHLARRYEDGRVERLYVPPVDLVIRGDDAGEPVAIHPLKPTKISDALLSSMPFALLPVLAEHKRSKPLSGYWLTEEGWKKYLAGMVPEVSDLVSAFKLWSIDQRIGVGLDAATRRAAEGRLFSVQAVALKKRVYPNDSRCDIGFLVGAAGAKLPKSGALRLGGDGRSAIIHAVDVSGLEPNFESIIKNGRCKMVLTTPGIFQNGWLPTGITQRGGEYAFDLHGVEARLICAAVPRAEVISGWNLAEERPKTALRAAPAGSVYWLEDLVASPESLKALVSKGLWSVKCEDPIRRAEGYNRFIFAEYN